VVGGAVTAGTVRLGSGLSVVGCRGDNQKRQFHSGDDDFESSDDDLSFDDDDLASAMTISNATMTICHSTMTIWHPR
jgi:hypothetical protein